MSRLDRFKRQGAGGRRAETDAEQALWNNLYRIPLEGTHFRRQVEIGPYRADFGSLRLKLLIEVDGLIHDEPARKERDLLRSQWLENEGYRVIRFSNHDVMTDMNSVLRAIDLAIESQKRALSAKTEDTPPRR
jgi:very-short-patch-repair endonuclease